MIQSGNNAIYWAARQGHVSIITFLHEKNVPINVSNRVRLFHNHLLFLILTSFLSDKNGETSLHVAARYGHPHIVEHLCKLGANVDCQDDVSFIGESRLFFSMNDYSQEEETPLIAAAWHDYSRICRILCSAGTDLNIRNKVRIEFD